MNRRNIHRLIAAVAALACLCCGVTGARARTALDEFTHGKSIGLIDSITRLDMADYYRSGLRYTSQNVVGESVRIISVDTLSMRYTPAPDVETELSLLPGDGADTVVMNIITYSLPQQDSRIVFSDLDGNALEEKYLIPRLRLKDWLTKVGAGSRQEVESRLPFICARADYDAATRTLTLKNTMADFYADQADRQWLLRMLRPQLTLRWTGRKFVLQKEK